MNTTITRIIIVSVITVYGLLVVSVLSKELTKYRSSRACEARFIAQGIDSKDIKLYDGTCAVITYSNPSIINPQKNVNYGLD